MIPRPRRLTQGLAPTLKRARVAQIVSLLLTRGLTLGPSLTLMLSVTWMPALPARLQTLALTRALALALLLTLGLAPALNWARP